MTYLGLEQCTKPSVGCKSVEGKLAGLRRGSASLSEGHENRVYENEPAGSTNIENRMKEFAFKSLAWVADSALAEKRVGKLLIAVWTG